MAYQGNAPATVYTSTTKDTFSGDGSTTAFTLSRAATQSAIRVVVANVVQDPGVAYTCTGATLTFTSAPPSGTNNIYVVHLGPPAATVVPPSTINNATTFTNGVTLKNEAAEDTDGGRESTVTFTGTQSGGEISTLAEIEAAHDGSADDEKGDLIFRTNDGADGSAPTERLRIKSDGHILPSTDNASDLGSTEKRFLDLHLSGGVSFDEDPSLVTGSVTAKTLDDYEEGTWTPSCSAIGLVGSFTHSTQTGYYTKIGNLVLVTARVDWTAKPTAGSRFLVSGLPFAYSGNSNANDLGASFGYYVGLPNADGLYGRPSTTGGGTRTAVIFYSDGSTQINVTSGGNTISSTGSIRFSLVYRV